MVPEITDTFNRILILDPEEEQISYTIRDPMSGPEGRSMRPRGVARTMEIESRSVYMSHYFTKYRSQYRLSMLGYSELRS